MQKNIRFSNKINEPQVHEISVKNSLSAKNL